MWKIDLDKLNAKTIFLLFSFFFLIAFCLYYPALWGGAIWDDIYHFFGNDNWFGKDSTIYYFWKHSFRWPIFESLLLILKWNFGKNYFAYHMLNIFFYSINAVLYFVILKKLNFKYVLLISLLYFVHPMNVQSVAWIIQFKSVISTTFLLISILGFILYVIKHRKRFFFISIIFFILMLLTKSFLVQLPILMIFCLYYLNYSFKEIFKKTFFYFLLSFTYLFYFLYSPHLIQRDRLLEESKEKVDFHVANEKRAALNKSSEKIKKLSMSEKKNSVTLKQNDLTSFYNNQNIRINQLNQIDKMNISKERKLMLKLFFDTNRVKKIDSRVKFYKRLAHMGQISNYYFYKMIIPLKLAGFYAPFKRDFSREVKNHILIYLFTIVSLFILIIKFLYRNNGINSLLLVLTYMSMLPVLGLVKAPFMSITDVSDHHMFISLMFFIPLVVNLLSKFKHSIKALIVVFLLYSLQTFQYSKTFKNSEAFYLNILKYTPGHMLAYLNLGHYYKMKKEYTKSYKVFKSGHDLYRRTYPNFFKYAVIDEIYTKAPYTSNIFYTHPVFDPYFLLITRHLASFVPVAKEQK